MTVGTSGVGALDHLRAQDVAALIDAQGWPSVSILLPTRPAERMTRADRARLTGLAEQAERELRAHPLVRVGPIVERLHDLVDAAARDATGRGLAVFVNRALARSVRLPVPVRARAVVEASFATRDLLHTLHRTPPHLVLVLSARCAHLYRGYGDSLVPWGDGFPVEDTEAGRGALGSSDDGTDAFLRRVDRTLGRERARHPSPLVLAGADAVVERFRRSSGNVGRLAAVLPDHGAASLAELHERARGGLEVYLRSREEEALDVLRSARRASTARVVGGIEECWRAATRGRPAMLVVEEGYYVPAVDGPGGPVPLDRSAERADLGVAVLHDLVDDLIEEVIARGGWVAFARDGALADHRRVAVVLPTPPSPPTAP